MFDHRIQCGTSTKQGRREGHIPNDQGVQIKLFVDPKVRPVVQKLRRVPLAIEEIVESKVAELLKRDIIEKVSEPAQWVSAVVPIKKTNGDYRICIDFRPLNKALRTQGYKMPDVESFLTTVPQSVKFSKFDFANAFFLIELDESSRHFTTFITGSGLYRFKILPMGLKCSPEEYQKVMDQKFADLDKVCALFFFCMLLKIQGVFFFGLFLL